MTSSEYLGAVCFFGFFVWEGGLMGRNGEMGNGEVFVGLRIVLYGIDKSVRKGGRESCIIYHMIVDFRGENKGQVYQLHVIYRKNWTCEDTYPIYTEFFYI